MALTLDFTLEHIVAAINTEIQKTGMSRGMISLNLQFEQVDPEVEGNEKIVGAYNLQVKEFDAPLGEAKKDGVVNADYSEEVAPVE